MKIPTKSDNLSLKPKEKNLVVNFENSFNNCLSLLLTNSENFPQYNFEEKKTDIEYAIESFVEKAKEIESFFIAKRFLHSTSNQDDQLLEEINDLKRELNKKDELIKKHQEKLDNWKNILSDIQITNHQSSSNLNSQSSGSSKIISSNRDYSATAGSSNYFNSTLSGLLSKGITPTTIHHPSAGPDISQTQNTTLNTNNYNFGSPAAPLIRGPRYLSFGQQPLNFLNFTDPLNSDPNLINVAATSPFPSNISINPSSSIAPQSQNNIQLNGPLAYLEKTASNIV
ncbi:unnamed protein product [Gordionus sp. m RMFG-2023]|uniref:uncharacterized protein LOC135931294 n=1 Tax=Gordionus sp. m RMFG-2023 TaxID=3053472 RepID=UPI0030E1BFD5